MKCLILAGGTGSRLFPLTHTKPKQLMPVANKPVLEYIVEDCSAAGIDEIGIILGTKGRREIQDHFGDGSDWGVDITYIVQGEPLGLAHAVACGRDFVGDDSFVVYLGDIMVQDGISDLVDGFKDASEVVRIGTQQVDNPSRYGVLNVDEDGRVKQIVEKPDEPESDLAGVGIGVFSPVIFEVIDDLLPSWRGELELSDANQQLIQQGEHVASYVFDGWWKDTGTPADMLEVNQLVLDDTPTDNDGVIAADEGYRIGPHATIEGPVSLALGAVVEGDARIGPYVSLGPDCRIDGARIESSIVPQRCEITTSTPIAKSLLGEDVTITPSTDGTRSLVLADDSTLSI